MKKAYIKPIIEVFNGCNEPLMVQISGTTTPEETESKKHNNWNFDDMDSPAQSHSTNTWETWKKD